MRTCGKHFCQEVCNVCWEYAKITEMQAVRSSVGFDIDIHGYKVCHVSKKSFC